MMRALITIVLFGWPAVLVADEAVSFRRVVAPILIEKCQACHGPKKSAAGYRVDTFAHLTAAGDSNVAGFAPNRLDKSEAFRRIIADDEEERMPAESDPLPEHQISVIRRWIEQGAKYDSDDPSAPLASIVPAPTHPDPPDAYPFTLPITALAFRDAEETSELYVSGYHEITVWNAVDGSLLRRIKNQGERTYALHFRPVTNGNKPPQMLAAAGGTPGTLGELRLFDATSGELLKVLSRTSDVVLDAAFNPSGSEIAIGGADSRIHIVDVESGRRRLLVTSHSDWVNAVAWSPDGQQFAGASRDQTAKVFAAESGRLAITYNGHNSNVLGVAFHPDARQIYSSDADGHMQLWKISDGKKTADIANFGDDVYKLSASGGRLLAGSASRSVRLFDMQSRKQLRTFDDHDDAVLSTTISPNGKRLATGAFDGVIKIWNLETGERMCSFVAAPGRLHAEPSK